MPLAEQIIRACEVDPASFSKTTSGCYAALATAIGDADKNLALEALALTLGKQLARLPEGERREAADYVARRAIAAAGLFTHS